MSRSYKHSPFMNWCGGSNKKDRSLANRKFRRKTKIDIFNPPISLREVSDTWNFTSDGLAHFIWRSLSPDPEDKDDVKRWMRK